MKEHLFGKTLANLELIAKELSFPSFVAKQLCDWLYKKQILTIEEMSNISLERRRLLSENFVVGRKAAEESVSARDGTKKYLFKVGDENFIEAVYIPDAARATLCVSSQVGCKMNCQFCMTARKGFQGNLSAGEILNQMASIPEQSELTNLVFMGMGEPFDNLGEVLKACEILTSPWGYAWSPRRITVSTIGHLSGIKTFMEKTDCHLAISLHSTQSRQREQLIPMERAYPMEEVISLLRRYDWWGQRRLSFEYIMWKGLNDGVEDARRLLQLLGGLPCRVNLIPYHKTENSSLIPTEKRDMELFRDYLTERGLLTTIRASRGKDIWAACGMLSGKRTDTSL